MAERTVNVRINYIVNTAEIQKARAASEAAQKATDDLRKSVDAYGKAASQAFKQQSDALKQVSSSTTDLNSHFSTLVSTVKSVVAAGIVRWAVDASLEMAKLAGNVESVGRAFYNQIPNSTLLLDRLRKATQGTVTDLELMQRTLKAQNFGIAVERLPELLEFAHVRAQQTGESIDYMVNSIVDGLGRKSLLKLDNLGISASRLKEEFHGASLQSLSVAEVTEGVANIVSEEMQKMGTAVETSATTVDQLKVSWEKLKTTISGSPIFEAIVINLKALADTADTTLKVYGSLFKAIINADPRRFKSFTDIAIETQRQEAAQISANEFITRRFTKSKEENIKVLEEEIAALTSQLGVFAKQRDSALSTIKWLQQVGSEGVRYSYAISDMIKNQNKFIEAKSEDALLDQEILRILQAKLVALQKDNEEEKESLGLVEAKREEIKKLQDQIEKATSVKQLDTLRQSLDLAHTELKELLEGRQLPSLAINFNSPEEKERIKRGIDELVKNIQVNINSIPSPVLKITPFVPMTELEKAFERNREEIVNLGLRTTENLINAAFQREVDSYSMRIDALRDFYDEQLLLAGDNERAKKELRIKEDREIARLEKQRADREKKAALAGILVNTALAVIKIFSGEGTYIDKLIRAGIMAAEGATQYTIANNARYYSKGEINIKGPGTETSDSIPAFLSKGESVMTAEQTRRSLGILTGIRNNQIDDSILKGIDFSGGRQAAFDDSRIVQGLAEIKNSQVDVVKIGDLLYDVRSKGSTYKKYVRRKSMGI